MGQLEVVELGCHQGNLAKTMLGQFDIKYIKSWVGYDICKAALARSVVKDKRYTAVSLSDWFYNTDLPSFNVFVSTHTFEHMDLDEIEKTFAHISQLAKYLILEIPISEAGQDFKGYRGAHVLTSGRQVIRDLITKHGFDQIMDSQTDAWITGWRIVGEI